MTTPQDRMTDAQRASIVGGPPPMTRKWIEEYAKDAAAAEEKLRLAADAAADASRIAQVARSRFSKQLSESLSGILSELDEAVPGRFAITLPPQRSGDPQRFDIRNTKNGRILVIELDTSSAGRPRITLQKNAVLADGQTNHGSSWDIDIDNDGDRGYVRLERRKIEDVEEAARLILQPALKAMDAADPWPPQL